MLRTINDRVALDLLLERGSLSRSDIARLTGVSKPTASLVLSRLEEAQLVLPAEKTEGHPGRGAQLFELNPRAGHAAAVDVTPREVHAQVADLTGAIVGDIRLGRPRRGGTGTSWALAALDQALEQAGLARGELLSVVIGAAGSYDIAADQLKFAPHLAGWQRPGLVQGLQQAIGGPVRVENDVNLAAIAERRAGAAQSFSDFFLFWVDVGIGGALMVDDRVLRGATGGAGELAYLHLPGIDRIVSPVRGSVGGLEGWVDQAAVTALAADNGLAAADPVRLLADASADPVGPRADFLSALARRFAIGLSTVIAIVDPAAIILTGSWLHAGGEPLRALISAHLDDVAVCTPPVLSGTVQDDPVLAGALFTALDHARDHAFSTS
ncbi:MAG TPA: ROK family transcriptional regulator [Candidatus Nanopelagicales bacterium]|nr:ROK family transcriptional regulator [Candidatus Nanopelagicales bacterium]